MMQEIVWALLERKQFVRVKTIILNAIIVDSL
jgi:hypothetical protein